LAGVACVPRRGANWVSLSRRHESEGRVPRAPQRTAGSLPCPPRIDAAHYSLIAPCVRHVRAPQLVPRVRRSETDGLCMGRPTIDVTGASSISGRRRRVMLVYAPVAHQLIYCGPRSRTCVNEAHMIGPTRSGRQRTARWWWIPAYLTLKSGRAKL
jgi:hypothetical protein